MLNKEDFDFYYLIICSRGPGSETITVNNVSNAKNNIEFDETAEEELKEFGVCGAGGEFNDEGPILAFPAGTKPFKGIYQWLVYDTNRWSTDREEVLGSLPVELSSVEESLKGAFDYNQPYVSACLRVFLTSDIGPDNNPWTSINGWRNVDIELPNKAQFESFMAATEQTAEQLRGWDCAVLKKATELYKAETLPTEEFQGC